MTYRDQAQTYFSQISDFYGQVSVYLGSDGLPPSTSALETLELADLQSFSIDETMNKASFSGGVASEIVAEIFCVQRELSMSNKRKSELIDDAVSEAQAEQSFYTNEGSYSYGVLSGNPTSGSTS